MKYQIIIDSTKNIINKVKVLLAGNNISINSECNNNATREIILNTDENISDKLWNQIERLGAKIKEDEKYNESWGC